MIVGEGVIAAIAPNVDLGDGASSLNGSTNTGVPVVADRIILDEKIRWYKSKENWAKYLKYTVRNCKITIWIII